MTKQQLKDTEKRLKLKFVNLKHSEIVLREEDFEDGKLTKSGYLSLKQQSDYIPTTETIEIRMPKAYIKDFKETLEYVGTKELTRIKTDIRDANIFALIFFSVGLLLISLQAFIEFFNTKIINDILIIVSWVFMWAAVEKRFFGIPVLKNRRINILHILSSNYLPYKKEQLME